MTHEEAARILDPETTREALRPYLYDPERRIKVVEEACRVAAEVLRGKADRINREAWEPRRSCCNAEAWKPIHKFCGNCGRPLTEEAWDEMEKGED